MKYGIRELLTRKKRFFWQNFNFFHFFLINHVFFPFKRTPKKGKKRHFWHFYMCIQKGLKSPKIVKKYFFSKIRKIDTKTLQIHFIGLNFDRNSLRYVIFNFDHFLRFSKKVDFLIILAILCVFSKPKMVKKWIFLKISKNVQNWKWRIWASFCQNLAL